MNQCSWRALGGAASVRWSLANGVQRQGWPEGEQKNGDQHDGTFIGHGSPSFLSLGKIFEDHEHV